MGNEKFGIWCLGEEINSSLYTRYKSGFRGFRFRKKWSLFETSRNVFNNAFWTVDLIFVAADGKYIIVQSIPGPNEATPPYLFGSPDLVPKIFTDRGEYAYGDSAAYKERLRNSWAKIKDMLLTLDSDVYNKVLVFQTAELSTGDPGTTKGTISKVTINGVQQSNPTSYNIPDDEWKLIKRAELWVPYFRDLVANNLPGIKPGINISNDGQNREFVKENMPGTWPKVGNPTHNHSIPGEIIQQDMCLSEVNAPDNENRFFAELEGTTNLAWFQLAPKKNIRTIIVSALAHGIDIINMSLAKMNEFFGTDLTVMNWANRYGGYRRVSETTQGFCIFRKIIDLSDVGLYPEGTYGPVINPASLNSYNRDVQRINDNADLSPTQRLYTISAKKIQYLNPARVIAIRALYPDALYLTLDQDNDHNSYQNDFGLDMIPGSYEKFVRVINQEATTKPFWRVGPINDYYGRFGLGFDVAAGKTKIYITEDFTGNFSYQVSYLVRYLDKGLGSWSVKYHNGAAEAMAGLFACQNTNTWKTQTVNIENYNGAGNLANSAKLTLNHESGDGQVIFDGVEFDLITQNTIPNDPPIADAGANQTITLPANTATLTGAASDPDGTIVSTLWLKIDGPAGGNITSPTSLSTGITGLQEGEYTYEFRATDNDGTTNADTLVITVVPADSNIEPVADAGANQTIQLPVSLVNVDLGASYDPDGIITGYLWTFKSGPVTPVIVSASSAATEINGLLQPGDYIFRGRVQDNDGNISGDTMTVTVLPPNNPPVVQISTPDVTIQLPVNSLLIDALVDDSDGDIASILWEQTEGTAATITPTNLAATEITGLQAGKNVFKLTGTDDLGAATSAFITITVNQVEIEEDFTKGCEIIDGATYELDNGVVALADMAFAVNADLVTEAPSNCTITLQYEDLGASTFYVNCIRCKQRARRVLTVKKTNTGNIISVAVTVSNFRFSDEVADFSIVDGIGTRFKLVSFVNNDLPTIQD